MPRKARHGPPEDKMRRPAEDKAPLIEDAETVDRVPQCVPKKSRKQRKKQLRRS